MMRRLLRRPLVVVGAIVFVVLSGLLARWLSVENIERDDILALLTAQARGDAAAMLTQLTDCTGRCRAIVLRDARNLARPGGVLILADQSPTAYSLTGAVGPTRIAWKTTRTRLPVVQCIRVSRTGNALSGVDIRLLGVSLPLYPTTADC
jgi:hypothetical protein